MTSFFIDKVLGVVGALYVGLSCTGRDEKIGGRCMCCCFGLVKKNFRFFLLLNYDLQLILFSFVFLFVDLKFIPAHFSPQQGAIKHILPRHPHPPVTHTLVSLLTGLGTICGKAEGVAR